MEIPEMLQKMVGRPDHPILTGKVTAINRNDYTCTVNPVDGSATLNAVRLSPSIGKYAMITIPKVNSFVTVVMVDKLRGVVVSCDDAEEILIGGEELGGMIKIEELVSRLNAIERAFNSFINTKYNLHVHTDPVSGSTGVPSLTGSNVEETQRNQLENEKVKHG